MKYPCLLELDSNVLVLKKTHFLNMESFKLWTERKHIANLIDNTKDEISFVSYERKLFLFH